MAKNFLPHISTQDDEASFRKKAFFVGYMVFRCLQVHCGTKEQDDRDYYGKKRLDMAGSLLSSLFRQLFQTMVDTMGKELKRKLDTGNTVLDIQGAIKTDIITRGLRTALATGNWGSDKNGNVIRSGVAQVLNRLTFASSLSHLRRLNTPIDKSGKLATPRQLHNTHWGMICPAETPEGASCGLVKNLSLMAFVSVGVN